MPGAALMQPRDFITNVEGSVASYDWTEIAEGSGLVKFYCGSEATSAGTTYIMLNTPFYPVTTLRELSTTSNLEINFYSPVFNTPRIVDGTAYYSVGVGITNGDTGTVTAQLKLYRGGSDIANISSAVVSNTFTNPVAGLQMLFFKIPLTRTNIQIGDQLHLVVDLDELDDGTAYIGLDPTGQDTTNLTTGNGTTTQMSFYCPFVIDL